MQTVTLRIEDSISEKFLWFLNHFDKQEVEILEKTTYKSDDEYIKSIKGMQESIMEASSESTKNYATRDELDW